MSMPEFPQTPDLSREDVINQIIASIAMEELGLSHIINAEGEKLQYVLGTLPNAGPPENVTIKDLLDINESIRATIDSAGDLQQMLKEKLEAALDVTYDIGPTGPTGPPGPTGPTGPPGREGQTYIGGGAIIPFGGGRGHSMDEYFVTLSSHDDGTANSAGFFGFNGYLPFSQEITGDTMVLDAGEGRPLFIPRMAVLTSYSAMYHRQGVPFQDNVEIHTRIYINKTGGDVYTALPETDLLLEDIELTPYYKNRQGIKSGLNIPLEPGTRVMISYYLITPERPEEIEEIGNGSGTLALA